jgi:hypothetical protein
MEDMYYIQYENELLGQDWLEIYSTEILDARYKWTDIRDVIDGQNHLTAQQKCDLLDVLTQHQKLFDGTLGVYLHKKVTSKLNLTPNQCTCNPILCPAFTCPHTNMNWTIS